MSEKEVLSKIYRTYTKEESINYLKNVVSQLRQEVGILKSEISELKDEQSKKYQIRLDKLSKCHIHGYIKENHPDIHEQIKKVNKKVNENKRKAGIWRNKYFDILARYNKLLENEQV